MKEEKDDFVTKTRMLSLELLQVVVCVSYSLILIVYIVLVVLSFLSRHFT